MTPELHLDFPATWTAQILSAPPLIAPARQFVYPLFVPGEEDAMNRGALLLNVKPPAAPNFLATCALGFSNPQLPSGVWSTPNPDAMLAVAGGYAYFVDTTAPEQCLHLALRPVTAVLPVHDPALILLAGFDRVTALGAKGILWTTDRLSWEGVTLSAVRDGQLFGTGWNMMEDRDVDFTVDLATGTHTGGGFSR